MEEVIHFDKQNISEKQITNTVCFCLCMNVLWACVSTSVFKFHILCRCMFVRSVHSPPQNKARCNTAA